jgi:hypothetical protein
LDWRSDTLFVGSDSFVACLGRPGCFALVDRKLP